jgi:hypothetical protein
MEASMRLSSPNTLILDGLAEERPSRLRGSASASAEDEFERSSNVCDDWL